MQQTTHESARPAAWHRFRVVLGLAIVCCGWALAIESSMTSPTASAVVSTASQAS
jgi:hypothetical protein